MTDYERIEKAIIYLKDNFKAQPRLEEVARQVYVSPFHFQRMFSEWAGVSPKKFLQFISIEYAKQLLQNNLSLQEVSYSTGLSGTSRLHDLFISIEGMSPGEYKNGGEGLTINYSFEYTPFGKILIASTEKGICHLAFVEDELISDDLHRNFPKANLKLQKDSIQQNALNIFKKDRKGMEQVKLHLKGTPFQLKVWQSLLKIPLGNVSTYAAIAGEIKNPGAVRAVGTAIANNPVAFLIPCHRVIRSTGLLGEYHWGAPRKTALFGWEASQIYSETI